jgi:3-oxoacyl-[acyl-carrier protein] reductase
MQLAEKGAIVTGGGTGVGRATALELARRGCAVLINYSRSQSEAEQTAADVQALGVKSIAFKADVRDDDACRQMVDAAVAEFGRLDVLVNSAARTRFIRRDRLDEVTEDDWREILGVNVQGAFQCIRAAQGALAEAGGGEIVNVSSVAAFNGRGSSIPYCASKAALNNLTIVLAKTLAPHNIRVNAVAPGFITGRWMEQGLGDRYEPIKRHLEETAPLRRVCQPHDVAEAILSLVAGSDLVTGQILAVDGGTLISY